MGPGDGVATTNGNGANADYQPALQVIILVCTNFSHLVRERMLYSTLLLFFVKSRAW